MRRVGVTANRPAAPRPAPTTRETRAGGALFVSPD